MEKLKMQNKQSLTKRLITFVKSCGSILFETTSAPTNHTFFQMAPDGAILPSSFAGRKARKARLTFLACSNLHGLHRDLSMFIENAEIPRCCNEKPGEQLGLYNRNINKAWMSSLLYFNWLLSIRTGRKLGEEPGCKIRLLLDYCNAHVSRETVPNMLNAEAESLPSNTARRLQPLDAGNIAERKVRYRQRQMEHALSLHETSTVEL